MAFSDSVLCSTNIRRKRSLLVNAVESNVIQSCPPGQVEATVLEHWDIGEHNTLASSDVVVANAAVINRLVMVEGGIQCVRPQGAGERDRWLHAEWSEVCCDPMIAQ